MGRIACVENVYDYLVGEGLNAEHASFDDLVLGCVALAVDPCEKGKELSTWIAERDESRTEEEIILDLKDYLRGCGCKRYLSEIVANAVALGRVGWEQ